jgi:hypothetical protein
MMATVVVVTTRADMNSDARRIGVHMHLRSSRRRNRQCSRTCGRDQNVSHSFAPCCLRYKREERKKVQIFNEGSVTMRAR